MLRWHRSRASRQDHLLHPAAIPVRPLGNKVTAEVGPGPNAGQARHIDRAEMLSQAPAYGPPMEVELTIRSFGFIAAALPPAQNLAPHGFLRLLTRRWAGGCIATLDQDLRRVKTLVEHKASNVPQSDATEPASIVRVPVPDLCALWAETATAAMNIALIGVWKGSR
jgi:hypothetical protein